MSARPRIVILGGGPAGVGAAFRLAATGKGEATVLERNPRVGGNAGSFDLADMRVDYGSHRLHPACPPEVMADIRQLLNGDLLDRPRHGRIRLRGRWIHFPLKPLDLALRLPPGFALGVAGDAVRRLLPSDNTNGHESFATVLEQGLGRTICRDFYFPYARKLWGLPPEELAATQARRRVAAGSLTRMVGKVLAAVPGLKPEGAGRFFYPRYGYGQISEAYAAEAERLNAAVELRATVTGVELGAGTEGRHVVRFERDQSERAIEADHVWSTIPLTVLARLITPGPPPEILEANAAIRYRAMILIYLVLEQPRFTEYDAHYFPEGEFAISRLSEPKNYGDAYTSLPHTVLCAELPCALGDGRWEMDDEALGELVRDALARAGIPIKSRVREVVTRRLPQAYPIYTADYEAPFRALDGWIGGIERLLSFGRQGLFAHDNTHHTVHMAYSAVDCLDDEGDFDRARWSIYRREFETHVVED